MQAASEPNFIGWLDKFYATWNERVASAVSECDGPPTLAADWTAESKRRLCEVASRVPDGLAEAVRAETALWTTVSINWPRPSWREMSRERNHAVRRNRAVLLRIA